jgi:hypothetical protein
MLMKKIATIVIGLLIILLMAGIALFRSRAVASTMSIQLSGVAGTPFTGYYVRSGQHIAVSGTLPWSLDKMGITEFEFRKIHPEDMLSYTVHYDKPRVLHSEPSGDIPPGVLGVRGRVQDHGFNTVTFLR